MKTLTTQQTAERLGVSVRRVNDLITSGRLPAERFGRAYMIQEGDLRFVENRQPGRPPKAKPEQSNGKKKGKK